MKLTKIKRRELKTGDIYCETIGMFQCPIFVQRYHGDTEQPTSLQQLDVLRIDAPDYAHEPASDVEEIAIRLDECHQAKRSLQGIIDTLTPQIKELGKENRDLKTIAANSESYMHRMDELLRSCKSDVEQRDERIEELITKQHYDEYCIDKLLIDQATLQDTVHQLRMKIFDIEGREDLVTTELERHIKEKDWRLGKQRSYIKGLVNDRTELQDTVQKMTADKHKMLSELKECHLLDIGDWQTRVDKLLAEIKGRERVNVRLMHKAEGLEDENRGLIKAIAKNDGDAKTKGLQKTIHNLYHCIDCIVDEKRVIDDGFRDTIAQRNRLRYQLAEAESKIESDKTNLELLDVLLKTLNPRIRASRSLIINPITAMEKDASDMETLCKDVIDFRRKYNIVG